jgi:hypothetical protein
MLWCNCEVGRYPTGGLVSIGKDHRSYDEWGGLIRYDNGETDDDAIVDDHSYTVYKYKVLYSTKYVAVLYSQGPTEGLISQGKEKTIVTVGNPHCCAPIIYKVTHRMVVIS